MNTFYKKIQEKRKVWLIVFYGFAFFFGCFTFPIVNFTPDAPKVLRPLSFLVCIGAYYETGMIAGALYHGKKIGFHILLTVFHVFVGMVLRYLLEFGEVSNTYNFTLPNIAVHMIIAVVICTASAVSLSNSISS